MGLPKSHSTAPSGSTATLPPSKGRRFSTGEIAPVESWTGSAAPDVEAVNNASAKRIRFMGHYKRTTRICNLATGRFNRRSVNNWRQPILPVKIKNNMKI
jgi:hypothetical protein